jgi:hypothetical protein
MQAFRIEERTPFPLHLPASEESLITEGTDCLLDAFGNVPIFQKKVGHKAKMHCKAKRLEVGLECGLCSQGYRKEAKHERSKARKSEVPRTLFSFHETLLISRDTLLISRDTLLIS